ncbi:YihY/virulence factor BrkB family protein [Lysobacter sp. TY2-98]|uniref:YihY/virulence factor BrkB family protein n=1 Tax=Lysobacter sp. TY2-98 TaxID=2290922 RepID=UPI000E1FF9E2|nr:YihY/virulence factor BrkB family protein [Lysobacter sp. TY2-98]AXK72986.1 YihY/virulence factor BrkB family protein [Lysobacter sp. TY2-98]
MARSPSAPRHSAAKIAAQRVAPAPADRAAHPGDAPPVTARLDPTEKASITQADGAPPPADVKKVVRKASIGTLPMALLRRFLDSDVITQAAALAFYAALAMAPLMLLLLWLTASNTKAEQAVILQVGLLVGPQAQEVARTVLAAAASTPDTGSIAGWWSIALLLIGASAVFAQLQDALNRIFRTDATALPGLWNWLQKRLLSFGLVLAVVFLLVISMTVTTVLDLTIGRYAQGETLVATLAALLVYAFTFALMYHFLPDRRVRWQLALAGGAFTSVLFLAGRAGIAWYLAHQSTVSAYGAMGALVLTMLWVYYAAMILFAGAVVTAVIDERLGPPRAPNTA